MGAFDCLRKNKKETVTEEKEKVSPFKVTSEILNIVNCSDDIEDLEEKLLLVIEENELKNSDLSFISSLILKYSVYNKKCLENNTNFVSVFSNLDSITFIKYFLMFCLENNVHFPPFLKYYNCGLMASNTKYLKFFEDKLDEHDFEVFKLILNKKTLSAKDIFNLVKNKYLEL